MKGRNRVEDTKTFGMCFWDADNMFYVTSSFEEYGQIKLFYTGKMQPNAQICHLVRV
jgi:hypothetical protein